MYKPCACFAALILAAGLNASVVVADSTRAECGIAAIADAPQVDTSACTLSQRHALSCEAATLASPAGCQRVYGDIVFTVHTTDAGSINQMTVQANGSELDGKIFAHELDGSAYRAEIADLDSNGWPEIYIYIHSAGSGSYGSLVAYAVNNGKSITSIHLRPLTDDPVASMGYMGHDEFAVVESHFVQRFPIYREGDTNNAPTGGTRQLQYQLVPGEAGWVLETERLIEY